MKKKNVLFRAIGPPTVVPNWFCPNSGRGVPERFAKNSEASMLSLRRNSNAVPWTSLVPDLVTMLTFAPAAVPNSAEVMLVWILNSWMASIEGCKP